MLIRVFQLVPTFRLLIAYIFGIVFLAGNVLLLFSVLLLSFWIGVIYHYFEKRLPTSWNVRWMPGLAYMCLWMAIGGFAGKVEHQESEFPIGPENRFEVLVELKSEPLEKKRSYQMHIFLVQSSEEEWKGKNLILYLQKDERAARLKYGDRIRLILSPNELTQTSDAAKFDYAKWLRNKGICATAYARGDKWEFEQKASRWNLMAIASRLRLLLIQEFKAAGLKGNFLALASAMSLGYRDNLDRELSQRFSITGISHILSVSGLHVAVVYSLFQYLLFFLGFSKRQKIIQNLLIILLLWAYAFLTGLSPSVNRSALMFSLFAFGKCLDKKPQTINTVLFSAFLLLLYNPMYLYDLGFQLSYCAVIAIVVVFPKVKDLWKPASRPVRYLWEMLCLSFVAQMATAPLTISCFGQFPNYFLFNNLLAVPLSGLLIYMSAGYLIFSFVPYMNVAIAWCLNATLHFFLWFVAESSRLPFALTEGLELHAGQVIVLYILMLAFFVWFFLKRRKWFSVILACTLCFQLQVLDNRFEKHFNTDICETILKMYLCKKENHAYQNY